MDVTSMFSEKLRELRGDKTLQEVADALGITRVSLGYYEKGERKPDIEVIYKIADYYKVSADYLLGWSEAKSRDIDMQGIVEKTGLSETVINKLCYYHNHENFKSYTKALNIILKSLNFESALQHIGKYMETVKIVDILQRQRRERYETAPSDGNWPYSDNLDKNYKENEKEMYVQEYLIDKSFKYLVQEIEGIAKEKKPDTK